jgi:hypothetical protein
VIETQTVQDGGVQVMDVDGVLLCPEAELVVEFWPSLSNRQSLRRRTKKRRIGNDGPDDGKHQDDKGKEDKEEEDRGSTTCRIARVGFFVTGRALRVPNLSKPRKGQGGQTESDVKDDGQNKENHQRQLRRSEPVQAEENQGEE